MGSALGLVRPWRELSWRVRGMLVASWLLTAVAALSGVALLALPGWMLAEASPVGGVGYAVAVVCVVAAAWVAARDRRTRGRAARAWADAHGWRYGGSSPLPGVGAGVLRTVLDGVGVISWETIAAPDLVSGGPRTTRHAVAARVAADLPKVVLVPETLAQRIGAETFAHDIQFESAAFNARWRVQCADAAFAHAFCHPRVMERLMLPDADGVSLLVEGRDVVVHAPGPQRLEVLDARARLAVDLVRLVPPYLLEQHPPRTTRRRVRRDEHSRVAAVLAVVLSSAWVVFALGLGIGAGSPTMTLGVVVPSLLLLLGFVIPGLCRRERPGERQAGRQVEPRAGRRRGPS